MIFNNNYHTSGQSITQILSILSLLVIRYSYTFYIFKGIEIIENYLIQNFNKCLSDYIFNIIM